MRFANKRSKGEGFFRNKQMISPAMSKWMIEFLQMDFWTIIKSTLPKTNIAPKNDSFP